MQYQDDYEAFSDLFATLTGIRLQAYKRSQMERRLRTLSVKHGMSSMKAYGEALKENPDLLSECKEKMTINVTSFFRNADRWERVADWLAARHALTKKPLAIWSAACSSGEEAYTVAMLCKRHELPLVSNQLQATDLDGQMILKAKKGRYSTQAAKTVMEEEMLNRFFQKEESDFCVVDEIKDMVSFSTLDLIHDAFPKQMDMVICRNVCIYFTEETKERIFRKLSDALKEGGLLFVGSTEQIFHPHTYGLKAIAPFFYQKTN
ncbi:MULTISPECIES: CheR family methyltransferase [Shouchella]|uniref:protein-glutamate O-methyltransferase n=2 Tax=Shouchella TaxID=2893057 RepID=A0ABY7W4N4_9BACI|nr:MULTISPECIES: protein-glutamate O-methyltransferase CheR [Shouchella]MED4127073.1 protein-glutamate O-methyltransferase CheR [Shouchella miscanthi]WDF03561.1 protein-glutamate O-methyltransferase CheR [Shouchella hunanensis]GAF24334.1 chemotaxis protein methyltransferase CheR [Bacillus sp. JCM 19047]